MIDESLQDQAALYASGALSASEREQFELVLEFHGEVRTLVAELEEVSAAAILSTLPAKGTPPPAACKARLLAEIATRAQQQTATGFVVTGPDGLVQWINPAFTEMCGYSLEELRGKKLGPILQGEKTNKEVAARMRHAVREVRSCHETILNYHKNGEPYWVEIAITPILNDAGEARWLVAREREVPEELAA